MHKTFTFEFQEIIHQFISRYPDAAERLNIAIEELIQVQSGDRKGLSRNTVEYLGEKSAFRKFVPSKVSSVDKWDFTGVIDDTTINSDLVLESKAVTYLCEYIHQRSHEESTYLLVKCKECGKLSIAIKEGKSFCGSNCQQNNRNERKRREEKS